MLAGVETAGTHRTLRRMQSPTDPADRTGTIGVEAFDATYGAGFQASDDSPHAVEVPPPAAVSARRPSATAAQQQQRERERADRRHVARVVPLQL